MMFVLGWEANSDSKYRLAKMCPSCAERTLPWHEHANEKLCFWESDKIHENKGTTTAGQARLEGPCLSLRWPCPCLRQESRQTPTQTQT